MILDPEKRGKRKTIKDSVVKDFCLFIPGNLFSDFFQFFCCSLIHPYDCRTHRNSAPVHSNQTMHLPGKSNPGNLIHCFRILFLQSLKNLAECLPPFLRVLLCPARLWNIDIISFCFYSDNLSIFLHYHGFDAGGTYINSQQHYNSTLIAPCGRICITYAEPSPSALSIYFVNPSVYSFGRNAAITPANPPPCTRHTP